MNALLLLPEPDESDAHRRLLLRQADALLTRVEELRLARLRAVPEDLQLAVRGLQGAVGQLDHAPERFSVGGAQQAIFSIQQRLMSANPRRPAIRAHVGRAVGSPVLEPIRPGVEWKLLVLPPQPSSAAHGEHWRELVAATVERALERWFYAQHHALQAVREGEDAGAALVVARVAWNNYWELLEEAARLQAGSGHEDGHR